MKMRKKRLEWAFESVLVLTMAVTATRGQDIQILDSFDYKTASEAQKAWQGTYPAEVPEKARYEDKKGLEFPCQFAKSGDRCLWQRTYAAPMDLSASNYFRISMYVNDGTNIKERSVAFGVAAEGKPDTITGWYVCWLPETPVGSFSFLMEKTEFRTEGTVPQDGWKRIAKIGISFWGGMSQCTAKATVFELLASKHPTKTNVELRKAPSRVYTDNDLTILPVPQSWTKTKEFFQLPSKSISVALSGDEPSQRAFSRIEKDFTQVDGVEWKVQKPLQSDGKRKIAVLGNPEKVSPSQNIQTDLQMPIPPEGYILEVGADGIMLIADDEKGFYYGFQTLGQLWQVNDQGITVPGVKITDFPTLKMRAMYLHWIGGKEGYQKARKFIRALSSLKINTVFIDVGAKMKYKSRPFPVTGTDAFSQDQMKELVRFAREYYIDLCPFYQMFGHCVWIAAEPRYRSFMEDPQQVDWYSSWCPSNPETFKFAKDILNEAVEVFHPPYIHIAHDEIDFTKVGYCSKCKTQNREDLIAKSMNTLCDFLKGKSVRTIVSGDTFNDWFPRQVADRQLNGDRILRQVRPSIIINGWLYGPDYQMHLKLIREYEKHGFTGSSLVFSPWYDDKGIRMSARVMKDRKGLGAIGTLWHDWGSFENYPQNIAEHCLGTIGLSANYFWNPEAFPIGYDQYDFNYRIRRAVEPQWKVPDSGLGLSYRPIGLTATLDTLDKKALGTDTPGLPGSLSLPETIALDGLAFRLDPHQRVIQLQGHPSQKPYPSSVTIAINQKADMLYFLHAVSEPFDKKIWETPERCQRKPVVGQYKIIYDDNTTVALPLKYRLNITSWNSNLGYCQGRIAWQGQDARGNLVRLGCTPWTNPHPDKTISRIEFSSYRESGMNPMLFAVTAGVKKSDTR